MEEIVLGLSKSVVEGTLSKVRSAMEEEAELKLRVQSDLVFITGEFEMMQSVLNVADPESIKNNIVRTWVRQLRDLAHDAEDCIELVVHLDPTPAWWRRVVVPPCMSAAALPVDEAVDEIKQLKDRVEYLSQRNMRYNLVADLAAKSRMEQQTERTGAAVLDVAAEARASSTAQKKGSLVDLTELLATGNFGVISVLGTGSDLGITSIIRKAYDDQQIRERFAYRGWAKLTHPFNPRTILRSLLIQFCRNTTPRATPALDELVQEFRAHVQNQRYLVVLEGLSSMVEWDTIRMHLPDPDRVEGSKIVVSTQHFDIASLCTGQPYKVSELRRFTADHSVYVFFKEVSRGNRMLEEYAMNKPQLIGRDEEKIKLISMIEVVSRVISVWGFAGVGKSALVRAAFYEYLQQDEQKNLFQIAEWTEDGRSYIHGWVSVPHPFNLRELCRSLLLDLFSHPSRAKEKAESDLARMRDPVEVCRELLSGDNICLLVFDDLLSAEQWDTIKQELVFGERCCIIVVTKEESVAKHCSLQDEYVLNVKGLDDKQSLQLFEKAYYKKAEACALNDDMKNKVMLILNKCGGLPNVISAVGDSLFQNLDIEAMNKRFMHLLRTKTELDGVQSLFGWLESYFSTCPDSLKPCIVYLSIFPRGRGIRWRRLVRRWIAEGYSRDTESSLAEVNGDIYFSRLVDLSMVQLAAAAEWHINDFFREYIISRSIYENHVFALRGSCSQTTQRTGRHLVIEESWDRDRHVFDRIDFSRLRSLTVFGRWEPFFASDKMRVVRVLDLEGATDLEDDDIKKIVRRLPRLKFLSLRNCAAISRLPRSLSRLRQLQTLDVRNTAVTSLPASVAKLKKLQYIRAGKAPPTPDGDAALATERPCACLSGLCRLAVGVEVPGGLGELTNLHTLGLIKSSVAGLKELRNLTQLRKLGVSGINWKNHMELCFVVSSHGHLESLSVWFDEDSSTGCCSAPAKQQSFKHPANIQRVKVYGYLDNLPVWIKDLHSLYGTVSAQD